MKLLCIYHGNCADGFGAAWVVRKFYGDKVEFHEGVYQAAPPDVMGRDVLLVDFSYKRPVLVEMAARANTITIIDHHKSAVEDLIDLPHNVIAMFDMEHSGAMLAWEHFFPGEEPPELLKRIEDRDLWKFKYENTRAVQAAVFSYPYDFNLWDSLMATDLKVLAGEGAAIERKHFKDIKEFIKVAKQRGNIAGYDVPILNCPYCWSSDAGHIMGEGEPFAACFWAVADGLVFSLRSAEEGVDVSEIATKFGGGGHKHAAGFKLSYDSAEYALFVNKAE